MATTTAQFADEQPAWRTDGAWFEDKAEWAVYEASRTIYGEQRKFEATIFTNAQHQDQRTTVKAEDHEDENAIPVFKHTISKVIPTDNYDYHFLTTAFIHRETMRPYKYVSSSQDDCGTSYREYIVRGVHVDAIQFSYFPSEGRSETRYRGGDALAFHDALTFHLRDYPFDAPNQPSIAIQRVPTQQTNRAASMHPAPAIIEYVGRETIDVPYGSIDTHHLRMEHTEDGGTTESHYWFAADYDKRHVLVRYEGPFETVYELKRLGWWAYWEEARPE